MDTKLKNASQNFQLNLYKISVMETECNEGQL